MECRQICETFFYVLTESVAGIDFDYNGIRTHHPPKFRYKAGSDPSLSDGRILVNYFQNRTIEFRTSVGMEIERIWPRGRQIFKKDKSLEEGRKAPGPKSIYKC